MTEREVIQVGSPVEGAPYSPGIAVGDFVFVSGQVPMDPATKQIVVGEFEVHVKQCLLNMDRVLQAAGTSLQNAVKVTVFLKDMNNFSRLNKEYNAYFTGDKPTRTCVEVARLPLDVQVEMEAIAVR